MLRRTTEKESKEKIEITREIYERLKEIQEENNYEDLSRTIKELMSNNNKGEEKRRVGKVRRLFGSCFFLFFLLLLFYFFLFTLSQLGYFYSFPDFHSREVRLKEENGPLYKILFFADPQMEGDARIKFQGFYGSFPPLLLLFSPSSPSNFPFSPLLLPSLPSIPILPFYLPFYYDLILTLFKFSVISSYQMAIFI